MPTTAEKTNHSNTAVQKKAQQQPTFFRKAGEESFFGAKEQSNFFSTPIQAKLTVSSPDDPQEKEADAVADQVMRMPEPTVMAASNREEEKVQKKEEEETVQPKVESPSIPTISRMEQEGQVSTKFYAKLYRSAAEGHAEDPGTGTVGITSGYINCKHTGQFPSDIIQRNGRGPPTGQIPLEQSLASTKGGGSALPSDTRQFMESRINADFSGVRIHTGSQAEGMSKSINAQAFTHGNDIYFNSGKYSPGTSYGGALLAHELTHTVQQGASSRSVPNANTLQTKPANNIKRPVKNSNAAWHRPEGPPRRSGGQPVESAGQRPAAAPVSPATATEEKDTGNKAPPTTRGAPKASGARPSPEKPHAVPPAKKAVPGSKASGKANEASKKAEQKRKTAQKRPKGKPKPGNKKPTAQAKRGRKAKRSSAKINAAELKPKSAPPAVASRYRNSQQVIDGVQKRTSAARETFAAQVAEKSSTVEERINTHMNTLVQAGASQEMRLKSIFSVARANINATIDTSSGNIAAHGAAQTEALAGAHTASTEQVNTVFTNSQEGVNNLTTQYADRSLQVANNAANQIGTNVQTAISDANQITSGKASIGDADSGVAEAKSQAAHEVGNDSAGKISEGMAEAISGILATGPETANEFTKQGTEAATQLMAGKADVDTQVGQLFTNATTGIGQMANGGVQAIQQQQSPIMSQFETWEKGMLAQLNQHVDQKTADFEQAGQQIMLSFRQQATQSLAVGDSHFAKVCQQISTSNMAESEVPRAQNLADQDITNAYNGLAASLDQSTVAVCTEVDQQGNQIITAVQGVASPIAAQVTDSVTQHTTQLQQSEQQSIAQLTDNATQAINGANGVVTQVTTGVNEQVTNIGTNFEQGVVGYQDSLMQQVNEGNGRAREPVNTLGGRIDTAQGRAAERARRSWLENQLADAWEAISDPGFWAGLIVGLILAVIFIIIIAGSALTGGALLLVLVAGFAVIGAIAAGIGSIVGQATGHKFFNGFEMSRVDWGQVGKAMLIGAAAGAALAIVAIVAIKLGVAATGLGMIAIMSVSSAVVGIITNVINGDPWDKGLLFNLFLGGLLTWLGGKLMPGGGRTPGGARPPGEPVPGGPRPGEPIPGGPRPGEPVPGGPRPGEPVPGGPRPDGPEPPAPRPNEPEPPGPRPDEPEPPGPRPDEPEPPRPIPDEPEPPGPRPDEPEPPGPRPNDPVPPRPIPDEPEPPGPRPDEPEPPGPRPEDPEPVPPVEPPTGRPIPARPIEPPRNATTGLIDFDAWATRLRGKGVRGLPDSEFVRKIEEARGGNLDVQAELRLAERYADAGYEVEIVRPTSETPAGEVPAIVEPRSPDLRIKLPGETETARVDVKFREPGQPVTRNNLNTRISSANDQIRLSQEGHGDIIIDASEASPTGMGQVEIENFLRGKMSGNRENPNARLSNVDYLEVVYPEGGALKRTFMVRTADGNVNGPFTETMRR